MWRILDRGKVDGGLVVGAIIKPKLGLQPKPFGEACYGFWLGGDFIKEGARQDAGTLPLVGVARRLGCSIEGCYSAERLRRSPVATPTGGQGPVVRMTAIRA